MQLQVQLDYQLFHCATDCTGQGLAQSSTYHLSDTAMLTDVSSAGSKRTQLQVQLDYQLCHMEYKPKCHSLYCTSFSNE